MIGILSSEEVQNAELDWIRILQHRMINENNYEQAVMRGPTCVQRKESEKHPFRGTPKKP